MISLSVRNTSVFPRSPVLKAILRRGVSTKELDAAKGGEFAILPSELNLLIASDRERVVILGSGSVFSPFLYTHLTNVVGPASSSQGNWTKRNSNQ